MIFTARAAAHGHRRPRLGMMGGMRGFFDLSTPAKRFRFIAWFEALTWAALLAAMIAKYGFGFDEAVMVPGMVHGVLGFIPFVLITLAVAAPLGWNKTVTFWALVSSVPPFGSVVFEIWAQRTGRLAELSAAPAADAALVADTDAGV